MTDNALPPTLLQIAGAATTPARWSDSVLVFIDAQEFYRSGPLRLSGIESAIAEARRLLDAARTNRTPVIHVVQQSKAGSPVFNPDTCRILSELTPAEGEPIVTKAFPDSFFQTDLEERLRQTGRTRLVVAGYMTHMCVSTSVRTATHRGYSTTLVADACATRDLPDGSGGIVQAEAIHRAEVAALGDRFAHIVPNATHILP